MKSKLRTTAVSALILTVLGMFILYLSISPKPSPEPQKRMAAQLEINKARFDPGETAAFSYQSGRRPKQRTAVIRYYHLDKQIDSQTIALKKGKTEWNWVPPTDDFKGYLAETRIDGKRHTIAIDVSSDWSRFPRYGFLSDFSAQAGTQSSEIIKDLNRYHVNGLQFYDWHYKHHDPLKKAGGTMQDSWQDIAGRQVSAETLKRYIEQAQSHGMKTMAYNLLYGSFEDAGPDGVKDEWRVYKDPRHETQDLHPLPKEWQSDVYLLDSGNREWQDYIIGRQNEVYSALPFDGWHIDQLGPRGEVYDYAGKQLQLEEGFDEFLHHAKSKAPEKSLVLNAVNQYGQKQTGTAPVDFMYTEVWDEYKEYGDLKRIIDENADYSGGKSTVLAAYMNYHLSKQQEGLFNTPGILLANSVIFSAGGAHLELGEHMLSSEYFPHDNLQADGGLKEKLTVYYDFLTAYQNLLRGSSMKETPLDIQSSPAVRNKPEKGSIWGFSKSSNERRMLHFINFTKANSLEWRDTGGTQAEPGKLERFEMTIKESRPVRKIWAASPDSRKAAPVPVHFTQKDGEVKLTLPSLNYWTMAIFEFEQ
ncbi:hypothetical protein GKZ89_08510 [Bacillus mangrovi]|uniref:Cycloisomaltooligosaccharide glucanotransferase n=1 Tax=Metabacillus mangrovi TaxID=1491830 RepID=A0A7X2V4X2_9BACI|nr:glycoside hydrolase family 66 protein [Metabacillus mangrovi]MTH53458.1 hypothetical protein [Metabacillus mangrovi]